MEIKKDCAVAIEYRLTIEGGIIVDASDKGEPLWYLHGHDNIVPGLEKELTGLAVGANKSVVVKPEEGYGVYDATRVHIVPKGQLPKDVSIGDQVIASSPDGHEIPARITAMDAKNATVDFNHELAGKTLTFAITVADVRAATKEELQHGHVHGPGGHHHH